MMCASVWRQAEYSNTYFRFLLLAVSGLPLSIYRGQGWESRAVQSICKLRGLGTDTCTWYSWYYSWKRRSTKFSQSWRRPLQADVKLACQRKDQKGKGALRIYANHSSCPILNVKALGALNQLAGTFSVIVKTLQIFVSSSTW